MKPENRVIWSNRAFSDLDEIDNFLFEKSPKIAAKTILEILSRTKQLESFPLSGPKEPSSNDHRYLVEGNYKIIYRVEGTTIFIVRVFDTRQDPKRLNL